MGSGMSTVVLMNDIVPYLCIYVATRQKSVSPWTQQGKVTGYLPLSCTQPHSDCALPGCGQNGDARCRCSQNRSSQCSRDAGLLPGNPSQDCQSGQAANRHACTCCRKTENACRRGAACRRTRLAGVRRKSRSDRLAGRCFLKAGCSTRLRREDVRLEPPFLFQRSRPELLSAAHPW